MGVVDAGLIVVEMVIMVLEVVGAEVFVDRVIVSLANTVVVLVGVVVMAMAFVTALAMSVPEMMTVRLEAALVCLKLVAVVTEVCIAGLVVKTAVLKHL